MLAARGRPRTASRVSRSSGSPMTSSTFIRVVIYSTYERSIEGVERVRLPLPDRRRRLDRGCRLQGHSLDRRGRLDRSDRRRARSAVRAPAALGGAVDGGGAAAALGT